MKMPMKSEIKAEMPQTSRAGEEEKMIIIIRNRAFLQHIGCFGRFTVIQAYNLRMSSRLATGPVVMRKVLHGMMPAESLTSNI